jgi:hypothetical protein
MWIGLTQLEADEIEGDEPMAMLSLYHDDGSRLLRISGAPQSLPELARVLRAASYGAPRGQPRCESCGADLGMPDLDRVDQEDSCVST